MPTKSFAVMMMHCPLPLLLSDRGQSQGVGFEACERSWTLLGEAGWASSLGPEGSESLTAGGGGGGGGGYS